MKYQQIFYSVIFGVGIGAAMSVSLNDTAVGMTIGFGVALAFAKSHPTCGTESK